MIVVGLLFVSGTVIAFSKRDLSEPKTEEWMIENSPRQEIEGFKMRGSTTGLKNISYEMDEVAYNTLDPYGIVARIYENAETGEVFDVVLIASQSKDSFHDPRVCFSAQGWALANQWTDHVETETRGRVPLTIAVMDGPDGRNRLAAFLYKGPPNKFYGSTKSLKLGMFLEQLKGGSNLDGVFYRFIPQYQKEDQEEMTTELKRFIGKYLDKAGELSNGYF